MSVQATMGDALEVLGDCRRYLTEFGSVEPSQLVRRIDSVLTAIRGEKDKQSYLMQLAVINADRLHNGKHPLTYSEFLAGDE